MPTHLMSEYQLAILEMFRRLSSNISRVRLWMRMLSRRLARLMIVLWAFIESDFLTFAIPNTTFGLVSALAGSQFVQGSRPVLAEILKRTPSVLLFNVYNLLIFDLANQRCPESVEEDRINKPWRPIPSKQITSEQARKVLFLTSVAALGCNYALGVWNEGLMVQVLSYYYNELKGGDGLLRDTIIAVSYGLANRTSLQIAIGPHNTINAQGHIWTAFISLVIMTTMHIQDLKDQQGDKILGRLTMPLVFGDGLCRLALAMFIPFWSFVSVRLWELNLVWSSFPCGLGIFVAARVLSKRHRQEDARTWRWWCIWHASLYALPLLSKA